MARDRRAALILQAAASGVVDFSSFDPYDRLWWLKLRWMLREVEKDNFRKLLVSQHAQHVGALTRGERAADHWKSACEIVDQLVNLYYPWLNPDGPKTRQQEVAEAKAILSQRFGNPDSPEGQERVRRTVEYLRGTRQAAKPASIRPRRKKLTAASNHARPTP